MNTQATPRVSVRFTSYQHAKYIGESIKSILAQDFEDFEIEITDDCSTDNSVEIIRRFSDPRIHLKVQDQNRGVASTATESLQRCRGEYTACMCSDDIWLPGKLRQQVSFLDNHPEFDAVFTEVDIINEEGQKTFDPVFSNVFSKSNKSRSAWLRQFFFSGNSLCIPSVLIRTSTYKALNGQNPTLSGLSDFDLWVRFSMTHDLYILPSVFTQFRLRNDQANESGYNIGNRLRCLLELQPILKHFAEIKDLQLFREVFPEVEKYGVASVDLIPYFLSRIALDSETSYLQLFGYNLLLDFMQSEKNRTLLERDFNFYTSDLHNYSKSIDPFNIQTVEALQVNNKSITNQLSETKLSLEKYRQLGGNNSWELTQPLRSFRLKLKKLLKI